MMISNLRISLIGIAISGMVVFGLIQANIFAEEEQQEFVMGGDVKVIASFIFQEGVETSEFQVFQQESGFLLASESPSFKLKKVVGHSPLLHKAADDAWKFRVRDTLHDYNMKFFDVVITISKENIPLRTFQYDDCTVSYYKVDTGYRDADAWTTTKGFTIYDEFTFICDGYGPVNVAYVALQSNSTKADCECTIKYKERQKSLPTWEDFPQFSNERQQ